MPINDALHDHAPQLQADTNDRVRDVGEAFRRVGQVLRPLRAIPVVGEALGSAAAAAEWLSSAIDATTNQPSLHQRLDQLSATLAKLDRPVVVLIDDLDRLRFDEVRDIVRLIKLTSDLPGTAFLVAYDRARVEAALGQDGEDGRGYLRKIVQVSHHLPLARPRDVLGVLTEGLDALLEEYKHGPFDSRVWQNLFGFFMRPLFTSLRDVRRYLNVLPLTLQSVGDEVAAVDVLGLEALRVMLPDVFEQVPRLRGRLAGLGYDSFARHGNDSERARGAAELAPLLDQSAPYQSEMTQFLNLLFPGTRSYLENTSYASDFLATWRRDRRVAHPDVLDFYLERILPTGTLPAELV